VGVDLEPAQRRPRHSVTALSSRFFHASESQALSEIPEPDRSDVFLELWLKKEALAKLTRKGLVHTLPLRLDAIQDVEFEAPALLPDGKRAVLAFFRDSFPGA
jgi:phosphopantetheinyl transferase